MLHWCLFCWSMQVKQWIAARNEKSKSRARYSHIRANSFGKVWVDISPKCGLNSRNDRGVHNDSLFPTTIRLVSFLLYLFIALLIVDLFFHFHKILALKEEEEVLDVYTSISTPSIYFCNGIIFATSLDYKTSDSQDQASLFLEGLKKNTVRRAGDGRCWRTYLTLTQEWRMVHFHLICFGL